MLLQLQKHLQTELRPFQVPSHATQKHKLGIRDSVVYSGLKTNAFTETGRLLQDSYLITIILSVFISYYPRYGYCSDIRILEGGGQKHACLNTSIGGRLSRLFRWDQRL